MQRRIILVALSAVGLAVLLFGVPLALGIASTAVGDERSELERAALRAAIVVTPDYRGGDPVELPDVTAPIALSLYRPDGTRVLGSGPPNLPAAATAARTGSVVAADQPDRLGEAVPVSANERTIAVVVATSPRSAVRAVVIERLARLALLGLGTFVAAGLFAYWQARRLARPMSALAQAATAMGTGDFTARVPRSGVPEIDDTADALAATADRLSAHIEQQRRFTAHASHQLRTPLTRLILDLDRALADPESPVPREAAAEALRTAEHLSRTIDDVLELARVDMDTTQHFMLEPSLAHIVDNWRGAFAALDRPLRLRVDPGLAAACSEPALRQIVQVLLDNAYRHGAGTVTVTARASGTAVAVDVIDQGAGPVPWPPSSPERGRLGLPMARSLAERQGGRLLLEDTPASTRFTLLIPAGAAPPK